MRIPRFLLLPLAIVLTASAYYLILFTNWGNPYHGGSYGRTVLTEAVAVFAASSCAEVIRTERVTAVRALAGAVGVPLVLVLALLLWYGVRRYVAA